MADALGVYVGDRAEQLVSVELDQEVRHHLLHLEVLLHHTVGCVWDVVHNNVQIDFVRLVSISVERLPHFDTVRVVEHFQYLKLSVFVPFVLEYFLDGHCLSRLRYRCFEDNSE